MRRTLINLYVDVAAFVCLLGLAGTGFILYIVLPPGSGGGSRGAGHWGRHAREFIDLSRHEWGDVHAVLALVFLLLIATHLVLHWTWIKNCLRAPNGASGS